MSVSRQEKEELNSLSKDVFGTSSRWQKLVNNGYSKLVTEKKKESIPSSKEGEAPTETEIDVPVLRADGAKQYTTERHTVASIKEFMVDRKKQLDFIRAEIKRQQDELKAQKEQEALAARVIQEAQGSAL